MPASERVLTQRELNRALLARQLLLKRGRGSLPKTLERIGGIQAQYAPAMYVGLWSRLAGFERDALTRALKRHTVVQGTLLRSTIHLVTPRDWWRFAIAVRRVRREGWLRYHRRAISAKEMAAAARRVRSRLAEGPAARAELQELIGKGSVGMNGVNLWIDLVRATPSGTWERRRADLFADAELWLAPAPEIGEAEATAELVRSYLRGFGPAAPKQIADWAGLPVTRVNQALERLQLRRFRGDGGERLVDLPRLPLPDPDTPAAVRFLPVWDATLLVHARRTQILPDEYRPRVFNPKTPHAVNTFLVDGQVTGTWKVVKGAVSLDPFRRLGKGERAELDAEAERLAAFHA